MGSDSEVLLHTEDMANKGTEIEQAFHRFLRLAVQCGEVNVAVVEV